MPLRWPCVVVICLSLALPASAAAGAAAPPQKNWTSIRSRNFYVVGDTSERNLRSVAVRLEQFREALGVMLPKAISVASSPVTVVVFRSHKAFDPFKPLYQGTINKFVAGFFQQASPMSYIALTTEGAEDYGTIYHEYFHFVAASVLAAAPLWYHEGLAEYYSGFVVASSGRKGALGKVHSDHVLRLRRQWLPLATLVGVDHGSAHYNENHKASVFYAESWALVHYLLLAENQKYFRRAGEFVDELARGRSLAEACSGVLQTTPGALELALREYIQRETFPSLNFEFSERIGVLGEMPVVPITAAEAHATLGEMLMSMRRHAEAQGQIEAALAVDPEYGPAHAAMGRLLVETDRVDAARPHLERAVAGSGATWLTHFTYASLLRRTPDAARPDTAAAIERALRTSIDLNPDFAESYAELASLKADDPATSREALGLIERALVRAPGTERYIYMLGAILARNKDYARAKPLLTRMADGAADDWVRRSSADLLARIRKYEEDVARAPRDDARRAPVEALGNVSRIMPVFRATGAGEERAAATLNAIECTPEGVALVVSMDGRQVKLRIPDLAKVEFITYREDLKGKVQCGARERADPVLITYRPDASARDGALGEAVAVEFPPEGFEPPR